MRDSGAVPSPGAALLTLQIFMRRFPISAAASCDRGGCVRQPAREGDEKGKTMGEAELLHLKGRVDAMHRLEKSFAVSGADLLHQAERELAKDSHGQVLPGKKGEII